MSELDYCIYTITFPSSHTYTGHTQLKKSKRKNREFNKPRRLYKPLFRELIQKYGFPEPKIIVVLKADNVRDMEKIEQIYINKIPKEKTLNCSSAFITEEERKKRSRECDRRHYENNKERRLDECKEYRDNNKAKINIKVNCPRCNKSITKRGLKRHQLTKRCQRSKSNT